MEEMPPDSAYHPDGTIGQKGDSPRWSGRADQIENFDRFIAKLPCHHNDKEEILKTAYACNPFAPCTRGLTELRGMTQSELRLDSHHRGRFIALRTVSKAVRWGLVDVLAEDVKGEVVIVHLHCMEHEERRRVGELVPEGTVMFITEPFLNVPWPGSDYVIRVIHLSDVKMVDAFDPLTQGHPAGWGGDVATLKAEEEKAKGNDAMKARKWNKAVKFYSRALLAPDITSELASVTKRNRAQAYLHLGQYDATISDITIRPTDVVGKLNFKAIFRGAEAQYKLGRFKEATNILNALRNTTTIASTEAEKATATSLFHKCEARVKEMTTGEYDFIAMRRAITPKPRLDFATYDAPVKICPSPGKGNGLFTTKAVKAGDLILCEKAFTHTSLAQRRPEWDKGSLPQMMPGENGNIRTKKNGLFMDELAQTLKNNPSKLPSFNALYHMAHIYEPTGVSYVDGEPIIDTFDILYKLANNDSTTGPPGHPDHGYGLYLKAARINHSCADVNVTKTFMGDFLIIRAARDMAAGTELFTPYAVTHQGALDEQLQSEWGFKCQCSLCVDTREMARHPQVSLVMQLIQHGGRVLLEDNSTEEDARAMIASIVRYMQLLPVGSAGRTPQIRVAAPMEGLVSHFHHNGHTKDVVYWAINQLEFCLGFQFKEDLPETWDSDAQPESDSNYVFELESWGAPNVIAIHGILRLAESFGKLTDKPGISHTEKMAWGANCKRAIEYAKTAYSICFGVPDVEAADQDPRGQALNVGRLLWGVQMLDL